MVYKNSTEIAQLSGMPIYMTDVLEACLKGKLNLFLQGDTGSGKTQLAADAMSYFPDKNVFILGRNDMDVKELFQQINLGKLNSAVSSQELKELTDKINYHLIVVDELPNCVSAVRGQLFNIFDGYVELNGKKYDIGNSYSVGIATGNIGQKFTESSNELGRALKDRMHVIMDVDYFKPKPSDTYEILESNQNPRVEFEDGSDKSSTIIKASEELSRKEIPFEKLIIANYLLHGLDYCTIDGTPTTKTRLKEAWPNVISNHGQGSDESLILPVSIRAAKSIIKLSQALDEIALSKGAKSVDYFESMMLAYKLASAYSGVLNDASVQVNHQNDKYAAMDAVISATRTQFEQQVENINAGVEMVNSGSLDERILNKFGGRWAFMRDTLEGLIKNENQTN